MFISHAAIVYHQVVSQYQFALDWNQIQIETQWVTPLHVIVCLFSQE